MRTRSIRPRRAFTLMEVLLVLLLLGIISIFVWPDFGQAHRSEEIEESLVRTKALFGMCRAESMNEARRYRITFGRDGDIRATRQRDPLSAANQYDLVEAEWAQTDVVLPEVFVEAVQKLPEGPPPLLIESDKISKSELAEDPPLVDQLDEPVYIEFGPDGTCESICWVFRDTLGRGRRVIVDGRLGRFELEDVPLLAPEQVKRPEGPADDLSTES